jgi:glycosyltransferase involved in cell wall biosynthesis
MLWWVMDLNPDQMVLTGKLDQKSFFVQVFDWLNRFTLDTATTVVTLDRFMAARLLRKRDIAAKLHILPPWAHTTAAVPHDSNPFRETHRLHDKFVVMYSGNAGITSPLGTLLAAAQELRSDPRIHFVIIGGGTEKRSLDEMIAAQRPPNITTLPYQPLQDIGFSLSAADIHVVSIAAEGVGVVHPCKVYGAMALGKPVLAFTPSDSCIADVVREHGCGWLCNHGDVATAVTLIRDAASLREDSLDAIGRFGAQAIEQLLSPQCLCDALCRYLPRSMAARH